MRSDRMIPLMDEDVKAERDQTNLTIDSHMGNNGQLQNSTQLCLALKQWSQL